MSAIGGSLVNVGRVSNAKQCQNIADAFDKTYFVSIPLKSEANDFNREYLCFVGGGQGPKKQTEAANNDDTMSLMTVNKTTKTNIMRRDVETEKKEEMCSCDVPIGYLTISNQIDHVVSDKLDKSHKSPPSMLNIYGYQRTNPWELRQRYSYYTKVPVQGVEVTIPLYKGAYDCMRVGCDEVMHGDIVELRNILDYRVIKYKVNMYQ